MNRVWIVPALLLSSAAGAADKSAAQEERLRKVRADLQSDRAEVRREAVGSLVHSDLSALLAAELCAALNDGDGKVREVAATAVGNLDKAAAAAVPDLLKQLEADPVKEARETAARALGRIGKAVPDERRAVAPLRRAADKDADPVTRVVCLGALAMMDEDVPGQVAALRKHLHHDEALVRMKAAHALGMIGAAAKPAAAEIAEALKSETEDGHRRGYIARALGNVGDPAFLPALLAAYDKETDAGARGEMRGAIAKLGGKPPK